jgi:hypothetical protein
MSGWGTPYFRAASDWEMPGVSLFRIRMASGVLLPILASFAAGQRRGIGRSQAGASAQGRVRAASPGGRALFSAGSSSTDPAGASRARRRAASAAGPITAQNAHSGPPWGPRKTGPSARPMPGGSPRRRPSPRRAAAASRADPGSGKRASSVPSGAAASSPPLARAPKRRTQKASGTFPQAAASTVPRPHPAGRPRASGPRRRTGRKACSHVRNASARRRQAAAPCARRRAASRRARSSLGS